MSHPGQMDLEEGGNPGPGILDRSHGQPQGQSTLNQSLRSFHGASDYGDSSWPIYLMYAKIAEEEDNKTTERCQKYTDGILIFSGLFSATVGALLTLSIPDLKPNSQDTSAFYLRNIYHVLGNPNVSQPSISSTLAEPPVFSPPSYAIWVNSLWFLSLAASLSSALEAMMFRKWVVDYIDITQWPWGTLVKQARVRAIFSQDISGLMWGTNNTHAYLHFSVLLFIAGGLIYLFNINHSTFYAVVWWVGLMAFYYMLSTVSRIFTPHGLVHTPLSSLALRIYLGIFYVVFQICSYAPPLRGFRDTTTKRYYDLHSRYCQGILIGKHRAAQEIASKPSKEIDDQILERILPTLNEDRALETFFDALPGFCDSKLTVLPLSFQVQKELQQALDGFLNLTFSSNPVSESVRASRLTACLNAAHAALGPHEVSRILDNIFDGHWDKALQSVEIGHALRLWRHGRDYAPQVRRIIACIITRVDERDGRWTMLVKETFGVPDRVLWDSLQHRDSALLSILIHVSREASRAGPFTSGILSSLSKFDIHSTLPGLQHDFCTLWNEIAQEARNRRRSNTPFLILDEIHHLYIALHQNAHATPTPFSTFTDSLDQGTNASHAPFSSYADSSDFIPDQPWSYLLCNIASHRPDFTTHDPIAISEMVSLPAKPGDSPDASPHRSTLKYGTALRQPEEKNINTGLPSPPDPSTTSEIGRGSHAFTATLPIHSCSPSSDQPPQDDVATAQSDTTPAQLSYPLEDNSQQGPALGLATPYAVPLAENSGTLSTLPTPAPLLASTPPVPNKSFTTYDASPAFITKSSPPAPAPDPLSPPPVPLLPNAELSLRSGMSLKGPSDNAMLSRLHTRRLVNNGDMLANVVLQLLVYCPPFRDLLEDARLVGQREGVSGGSATLLMDASVRFLDESAYKERSSVAHQFLQQAGGSKVREDEDRGKQDGGVHSYLSTDVFDAMKEKRQFIIMRDDLQQDAAAFLGHYLEALDEELVTLQYSIGRHRPAAALEVDELKEETQSGDSQTEMRERDYTASSVESPISRIFGGRSRLILRAPNKPDIVTVEDWRSLKLNIQPKSVHTIQDALTHITRPQPVEVEIGQSGSSEASQQVLLEALPSILVLHLERFLYDAAMDGSNKINKFVQFAPELQIPLDIMAPVSRKSAELAHYKLHGVLYHHGESASSGHYAVDVLHRNGGGNSEEAWLHIDDEAVSAVQHEDVFGDNTNEPEDERCAYMLFYCRTAPARA